MAVADNNQRMINIRGDGRGNNSNGASSRLFHITVRIFECAANNLTAAQLLDAIAAAS